MLYFLYREPVQCYCFFGLLHYYQLWVKKWINVVSVVAKVVRRKWVGTHPVGEGLNSQKPSLSCWWLLLSLRYGNNTQNLEADPIGFENLIKLLINSWTVCRDSVCALSVLMLVIDMIKQGTCPVLLRNSSLNVTFPTSQMHVESYTNNIGVTFLSMSCWHYFSDFQYQFTGC